LSEATVGRLAGSSGGAVDPVECGGDVQDPAPRLEEVAVKNRGRVAGVIPRLVH
jgi:hypothetical protein